MPFISNYQPVDFLPTLSVLVHPAATITRTVGTNLRHRNGPRFRFNSITKKQQSRSNYPFRKGEELDTRKQSSLPYSEEFELTPLLLHFQYDTLTSTALPPLPPFLLHPGAYGPFSKPCHYLDTDGEIPYTYRLHPNNLLHPPLNIGHRFSCRGDGRGHGGGRKLLIPLFRFGVDCRSHRLLNTWLRWAR